MGVVFAGALLVVTAGCTPDSFTLLATHKSKEQIMPGSPQSVSMAIEGGLGQMGLLLNRSTPRSDTIRIDGRSPVGERFALFFRKPKGEPGEKTVMRIEWEKNGDDVFWGNLIQIVLKAQNQPQMSMMPGQQVMPQGTGGMPVPQGFPPTPGMQQPTNGFATTGYPPNPPLGNGMPPQGNYQVPQGQMYPGGNPAGYGQQGQYGPQGQYGQ